MVGRFVIYQTQQRSQQPTISSSAAVCVPLQEDAHKVDRQAEDEEKKKMAEAYWMFDGHPRKFREIVSRRKKKKGEPQTLLMLHGSCLHLLLSMQCWYLPFSVLCYPAGHA
jgi:hypothetical protein